MLKYVLFATCLLLLNQGFAHNPDSLLIMKKRTCFREGDRFLTFGTGVYGLNNAVKSNNSNELLLGDFTNAGLPPVFVRYESAISDVLGVGGTFFFHLPAYRWNKTVEVYDNETWTYVPMVYEEKYGGLSIGFLARANLHFATTRKSDPYIGAGLGYEFFFMKMTSQDPLATDRSPDRSLPFSAELVFGFRTYVSDQTALYAEVGYGKMLLNLGLSIALDQ